MVAGVPPAGQHDQAGIPKTVGEEERVVHRYLAQARGPTVVPHPPQHPDLGTHLEELGKGQLETYRTLVL